MRIKVFTLFPDMLRAMLSESILGRAIERGLIEVQLFNIRDYTDKVFWMYDGPEEKVTLLCKTEILDQVIDRFGEDVELTTAKTKTKGHFTVTVPVRLSTTFYAWVFQFVGKMSILAPEHVRESYTGYLEEALDDVMGE